MSRVVLDSRRNRATRAVRVVGRIARDFAGAGAPAGNRAGLDEATDALARDLLARLDDEAIALVVDAECRRLDEAGLASEPGYLLARVADLSPATGVALAAWVISAAPGGAAATNDGTSERRAGWLANVLPRVRGTQPDAYHALLGAACASPHPFERRAAAAALARVDFATPWDGEELACVRDLLSDTAVEVRRVATWACPWDGPRVAPVPSARR